MFYVLHLLFLSALYATVAESLSFLIRNSGRISLAHGALFGIGAYATALGATELGWTAVPVLVLTIAVAVAGAIVFALLSSSFESTYFVLLTFALQLVFSAWLVNSTAVGGSIGVSGIGVQGIDASSASVGLWAGVALCTYGAVLIVITAIERSPFGRLMRATREDALLAASHAKNVSLVRTTVFVLAASMTAACGGWFAYYNTYIDPSSFNASVSLTFVAMVVLGGSDARFKASAGAVLFVVLPEALRWLGASTGQVADLRQIVFGSTLIAAVVIGRRRR